MIAQTENVGRAFPEEARKIHYEEAPKRGIRGQATAEEAEELRDEGDRFHVAAKRAYARSELTGLPGFRAGEWRFSGFDAGQNRRNIALHNVTIFCAPASDWL